MAQNFIDHLNEIKDQAESLDRQVEHLNDVGWTVALIPVEDEATARLTGPDGRVFRIGPVKDIMGMASVLHAFRMGLYAMTITD